MRRFLRENGLSVVLFGFFLVFVAGQFLAGLQVYRSELREHGDRAVTASEYIVSGHFFEAIFENWESEFLQMGAFVLMTIALKQKGSSESKPLDDEGCPAAPRRLPPGAPSPVRRGGWRLRLYEHSLTIALMLLFVVSLAGHAVAGSAKESEERRLHGKPAVGTLEYAGSSQFWFESFQNWQSEFLSVGMLIVLSIFLRQKGSPQSKEVWEPHAKTGTD